MDPTVESASPGVATNTVESLLEQRRAEALQAEREARQNLPAAIAAGVVAALIAAAVWATITVVTQFQIGWMAVGAGFLVGHAVRHFGRGLHLRLASWVPCAHC